jgi:hypothetical protein
MASFNSLFILTKLISILKRNCRKLGSILPALLSFWYIFTLYVPLNGNEDFLIEKESPFSPTVYEYLEELKENPLDLNSCSYEEFILIPYVTPDLALRVENYRKNHTFNEINDLLTIAGFNGPLVKKISPYLTVKKKFERSTKKDLTLKITAGVKYPKEETYRFSPLKVSTKATFTVDRISAGGAVYKDAYEESYMDFYTLFLSLDTEHHKVIIGDYGIDIGERLILGYPGFTFKSSGAVKGKEKIIRPYLSGFEDYSLRGCGVEKRTRYLDIGLFTSYKPLDATVVNDTVKRVLYETGYHRTDTEREKKDRISERLIGGTLKGGTNTFTMRTTTLFAEYTKDIVPDDAHYYRFRGKKYDLSGIHLSFSKNQISFWSEFAHSFVTKGTGLVSGISCRPENATISILYREYSETFYSPRAFSFSETEVRNERGFYTYLSTTLFRTFDLSGYIDIFIRPNPTYFTTLSLKGYEIFASLEKKIRNSTAYVRYKRKEKESFQWEGRTLQYERQNLRFSLKSKLSRSSEFKIVWEGILFSVPEIEMEERGNLFSLSHKSSTIGRTTYEGGIVLFEIESYNSRIYLFQNDIPGSMYTKPFFGRGSDLYLVIKSKITGTLRIYGKLDSERKDGTSQSTYKLGVEWR